MSDHLHDAIFDRSLDDLTPAVVAPCEHGRPAKRVTVVDRARKSESNQYGDIEVPVGLEHLATMASIRDDHAAEHPGEPGRFVLVFVHPPCCRTEQPT